MRIRLFFLISLFSILKGNAQTSPYFFMSYADTTAVKNKIFSDPTLFSYYQQIGNGSGIKWLLQENAADRAATRNSYNVLKNMRPTMYIGSPSDGDFGFGRRIQENSFILDRTINSTEYTQTERQVLMVSCDSIAWRLRDPSYATEYAAGVINNRTLDVLMGVAYAGVFLFPNNPNASNHYNYVITELQRFLNAVLPDGTFPEVNRYVGQVDLRCLINFSKVQRRYLGNNSGLVSDPRLKSIVSTFLETHTPKDALDFDKRGVPAVGDGGWGSNDFLYLADAAAEIKLTDTVLASKIMGMFVQAGKPLSFFNNAIFNSIVNYDTTILPDTSLMYQSKVLPNIGYYIFRNNYATDDESFLLSHVPSYNFVGHTHFDAGSFSLFAFNTPLMLDPGSSAYVEPDVSYYKSTPLHNVVSFTDLQGNNVNGLAGFTSNASSILKPQYDFWSANIGDGLGSNSYQRSMALLKVFDNTIIVFDVVKTSLKTQANFNVFSNRTSVSNMGFYKRSLSQCYNNVDLQMDHLLNSDNLQISKNKLGDCPSNWPKNLSDSSWSRYQQNVSSATMNFGDANYLTIIRPTKSGTATHTIYQIASSNPQIKIYKILDKNTNNYFVLIANVSKENTVATSNFPALVALKNMANDAVLTPLNSTISVQLDYGAIMVLMPETMSTTNTGPSLAAIDITKPVFSVADNSADQNSQKVGINTISVHQSAIFEVSSSNKGLLLPRVTMQEMQNIASPVQGLTVYCTSCVLQNIYWYDGTKWLAITGFSVPIVTLNPVITVSPINYTVGTSITLTAIPGQWKYAQSFTYQWKRNGVDITAATSSTFTTTANGTEKFECLVTATNNLGAATAVSNSIMSSDQIPTVIQTPIISKNGSTYFINTPPSFANGNGGISYQWLYNITPIAGATSLQFTADASYLGGMVQLACSITNNAGTQTVLSNALPINLLLDNLTSVPSAAYSLRKLRLGYTGSAVRVRKTSDNAFQDIGFTSTGDLDLTTLLTFAGNNDVTVATWYDQSGNNKNAVQSTPSLQAPLVVAGLLQIMPQTNKPAIYVNVAQMRMTTPLSFESATGVTLNAVLARTTANGVNNLGFIAGTAAPLGGPTAFSWHATDGTGTLNTNLRASQIAVSPGASIPAGQSAIMTSKATFAGTGQSFKNSLAGTQTGSPFLSGVVSTATIQIWAHSGNLSRCFLGYSSEFVFFNSNISNEDRFTMELNQKSYYGISF